MLNEIISKNKIALEKFFKTVGEIKSAFEKDPSASINFLRLIGFRCAECGSESITGPVLKFNNFSPETKCWECQQKNQSKLF